MHRVLFAAALSLALAASAAAAHDWGKPKSPVIPQADGFFRTPGAALIPIKGQTYQAVFDATRAADKPDQILPALNMAGSELNLLVGVGLPVTSAKFVVVFHGDGLPGLLTDVNYRARFHTANPNLPVLAEMRRQGVELYVCGQNLAFEGIDPKSLSPDVRIASDALIVLMQYQMRGYALMSF